MKSFLISKHAIVKQEGNNNTNIKFKVLKLKNKSTIVN